MTIIPDPPVVDEEAIYEFYIHNLLPALLSSLPVLLSRFARDMYSLLGYYTTMFIQFLFPVWFRRWTIDTTDTIARAASEGGDFLAQIWPNELKGGNTTFVDYFFEKLNNDGGIRDRFAQLDSEQMKRELELMIQALTDRLNNQQHASWYAWLRAVISNLIGIDWSFGAYLWRTCSGLIIVLIVTSIIPGRLHGWTGKLLRFPVLGMTYMLISVELIIYTIIRFAIRAMEGLFAKSKHRAWRKELEHAKTYEKWYDIAKRLDRSQGREQWQNNVEDDTAYRYSWPFIRELLSDLKASRENKDVIMALAVLQQCTRKNVGGIMSDDLFSFTNCGEPKNIVSEFVDEVEKTLLWVTEEVRNNCPTYTPEDDPDYLQEQLDIDRELRSKTDEEQKKLLLNVLSWATLGILSKDGKKKQNSGIGSSGDSKVIVSNISQLKREEYIKHIFLKEKVKTVLKRARAAYGRTALCLSGGAMMGNYHFGAVKALLETDLLPHIISGTSAGSVIGAMICTRTEEELARDMRPDVLQPQMKLFASSWGERIARLYRHGTMFDHEDWHRRVRWFTCGDMTFEEAYKKTGRVFCVSLSATSKKAPPILVNYITAPNVVIASAVVASASVPGFINATKLQVKDENGNIRYQAKSDEAYRDGSIDSDIPTTGLAEMLNCRFFLAAQANPHIVPFFYNAKGDVGRPSRWSSGARDDSWRGGFLLSALEMYLKNDMRSKFHFLNDLEVAVGFTSTMMTQVYSGSTTIVPQVCLRDFLVLFQDQTEDDMRRYFQGGAVAAYQHVAMLKLHYKIARALEQSLASLERDETPNAPTLPSLSMKRSGSIGGNLYLTKLDTPKATVKTQPNSRNSSGTNLSELRSNDEHEKGGFDGIECSIDPVRRSPAFE